MTAENVIEDEPREAVATQKDIEHFGPDYEAPYIEVDDYAAVADQATVQAHQQDTGK